MVVVVVVVVDALFYNFAPGVVARRISKVWRTTTPEAAIAAHQRGCVQALELMATLEPLATLLLAAQD